MVDHIFSLGPQYRGHVTSRLFDVLDLVYTRYEIANSKYLNDTTASGRALRVSAASLASTYANRSSPQPIRKKIIIEAVAVYSVFKVLFMILQLLGM